MTIYGDPVRYYGAMAGVVLWDGARIMRTDDISVASPTWETIDTGISGTILDVQMATVDDNTVGAWCLTDAAVYWCADVEAATPTWTSKLAIATVQASDATPTTGSVAFKNMAAHPTVDGYLIVTTGPDASDGSNSDYPHAYTWHTHDWGANWTQDDMTSYLLLTSSGPDVYRGYCYSSVQACEIAADGKIYLGRVAPVVGVGSHSYVFRSSDLGDSWAQLARLPGLTNNRQHFSVSAPDADGIAYAVQGTIGVSTRPDLLHTNDEWGTRTTRTTPAGYGGIVNSDYRVARIYGDADHVRTWYRESATTEHHLLASDDQGVNWTTLWEAIPGSTGIVYNPPVNWPPDPLEWLVVANDPPSGNIANVILYTDDDFATRSDKSGNLEALIGTWTTGICGCFIIPKPGTHCKPRAHYVYNSVDITDYCNAIDLEQMRAEHQQRHLGRTAEAYKAGVGGASVRLKGDWNPTIDALLGKDAYNGTQRTGVVKFDDCTNEVSYTWTSGVMVTNWQVRTVAPGKIEWSATLRHNRLGVRSVAAS